MKIQLPKITDGPWFLNETLPFPNVIGSSRGEVDGDICKIAVASEETQDDDETLANACAMAAVPALLNALALIYANAGESPEWIRERITPALLAAGATLE